MTIPKSTPETLCAICDYLVSRPNYTAAARAVGLSEKMVFVYMKRSAEKPEDYMIRYPDPEGEPIPFHVAVAMARKQSTALYEAIIRDEVMHGVPRVLINNGKIVYKLRDDIVLNGDENRPPDELEALYGVRTAYALDDLGRLIPEVVYESAPAALRVKVIESLRPSVYGQKVQVDSNVSGSVMVIGAPKVGEQQRGASVSKPSVEEMKRLALQGPANPRPSHRVDLGNGGSDASDPPEGLGNEPVEEASRLSGTPKPEAPRPRGSEQVFRDSRGRTTHIVDPTGAIGYPVTPRFSCSGDL
jgi:hypothetical protein